jgi:hypothetical protein
MISVSQRISGVLDLPVENVIPECNHKCECKLAKFLLSKCNNKISKHNWMYNNLHNGYSNGDS